MRYISIYVATPNLGQLELLKLDGQTFIYVMNLPMQFVKHLLTCHLPVILYVMICCTLLSIYSSTATCSVLQLCYSIAVLGITLNGVSFPFFRRVIHTVGPKYAVKYHTAAENALSHCYRSCLELLIENGLQR